MDFDPRDYDSRDDDRFPSDRHHGGRGNSSDSDKHRHDPREDTRWLERERDPRDVFMRDLNLPRGLEASFATATVSTPPRVGDARSRRSARFGLSPRAISAITTMEATGPAPGDLRHLREAGLVETARLGGRRDHAVPLTKEGRDLLHEHRRTPASMPARPSTRASEASASSRTTSRSIELTAALRRALPNAAGVSDAPSSTTSSSASTSASCRSAIETATIRRAPGPRCREIALWAVEHDLPYFDDQCTFRICVSNIVDRDRGGDRRGRRSRHRPLSRRARGRRCALGVLLLQRLELSIHGVGGGQRGRGCGGLLRSS